MTNTEPDFDNDPAALDGLGLLPVVPDPTNLENVRRCMVAVNKLVEHARQNKKGRHLKDQNGRKMRNGDRQVVRVPRLPNWATFVNYVKGTVVDAFTSADATFQITGTTSMNPVFTYWDSDDDPLTVANTYHMSGAAGDTVSAVRDHTNWIWEMVNGSSVLAGITAPAILQPCKVQSFDTSLTGESQRTVSVKTCSADGTGETGDAYDVLTPLCPGKLTRFFTGDILYWIEDADGNKILVGPFDKLFDGFQYEVRMATCAISAIPSGWARMDGTENAAANGGSGIVMESGAESGSSYYVRGFDNAGACGNTVYGANTHTHSLSSSINPADGSHAHSTSDITIADHTDHTHGSGSTGAGTEHTHTVSESDAQSTGINAQSGAGVTVVQATFQHNHDPHSVGGESAHTHSIANQTLTHSITNFSSGGAHSHTITTTESTESNTPEAKKLHFIERVTVKVR